MPSSQLTEPFVVEVQDVNAEPVVGATVTFTVTAGRGNVSAATATTDANGQAQTYLTLGSTYGANAVKASVRGVFRGATFKATSQAQVHIDGAMHPPMYWINTSTSTLHRLVRGKVKNLVPGAQNITSLAVDAVNGFLYFSVKTGANSGEIRRSELTGGNIPKQSRDGLFECSDGYCCGQFWWKNLLDKCQWQDQEYVCRGQHREPRTSSKTSPIPQCFLCRTTISIGRSRAVGFVG